MVLLAIGTSQYRLSFSSLTDRNAFARRAARARLRGHWTGQLDYTLPASAKSKLLQVLAQEGGTSIEIVAANKPDPATAGESTPQSVQGRQLRLW